MLMLGVVLGLAICALRVLTFFCRSGGTMFDLANATARGWGLPPVMLRNGIEDACHEALGDTLAASHESSGDTFVISPVMTYTPRPWSPGRYR
jgi:hypothetical protein